MEDIRSNSWTMKDKTLNNTDWQMGLMSMMLCHKSCETKQNHEMENVIENVICFLKKKHFVNNFKFPVKNDRSAVDIRNRPRIPVPDEVFIKMIMIMMIIKMDPTWLLL